MPGQSIHRPDGDRLLAAVLRLFEALNRSGVDCSLAEAIDAASALTHIDLLDRDLLHTAMQATLAKRVEDLPVFDTLFERCFPLTASGGRLGHASAASDTSDTDDGTGGDDVRSPDTSGGRASDVSDVLDVEALAHSPDGLEIGADELMALLREGTPEDLRDAARRAVDAYGGVGDARGSERYFLARVLRALDLARVLVAALRTARESDPDADPFTVHRRRDEMHERLDMLKQMLAAEIARQLFAGVGAHGVGLVAPRRIEDTAVLGASARELREMRAAIRPLAEKLARRMSQRRRRPRHGRLDVRRTVRRSLSTGGVPLEPQLRRRAPHKPEVVALCDISGSVAEFAHFTLMLLQSLHSELRGLRSFVFVDGIAEITSLLERAHVDLDPRLLVTLPGVVVNDGHSDYDAALHRFLDQHQRAVGPSTTVIVTGDGRTNYRNPGVEALRILRSKVRSVYWFDPEPAESWGSHDSAMALYRVHCDAVFEVRTLAQLSGAIAAIL